MRCEVMVSVLLVLCVCLAPHVAHGGLLRHRHAHKRPPPIDTAESAMNSHAYVESESGQDTYTIYFANEPTSVIANDISAEIIDDPVLKVTAGPYDWHLKLIHELPSLRRVIPEIEWERLDSHTWRVRVSVPVKLFSEKEVEAAKQALGQLPPPPPAPPAEAATPIPGGPQPAATAAVAVSAPAAGPPQPTIAAPVVKAKRRKVAAYATYDD
ncbi:unnamed protein product [Vitrella brassicaformis CCMP3155]|uniref:CS domain-containing protein n=1 Tax=Vitrella brassicaformis (strain CCMP3155) TaxID=1169540 RepID=A0A0G4G0H4_VITBC|nr:unnamed protein product [Vitrella brassicaformis CCMP3155]|eukprot:CEM21259.1 unnamed protein product [Vitrella brassicaformis CCMP3155]